MAETETFTVASTSSGLQNPVGGSKLTTADLNSRSWIKVTFTHALAASVLDNQAEFVLASSNNDPITIVGSPVRIGTTDSYLYFIVGFTGGSLAITFTANSWTDTGDVARTNGEMETATSAEILSRTWLDVRLSPAAGTVDRTTVTGNELGPISGLTAYGATPVVQVGDTTFRYLFTGDLAPGTVTVTVLAGSWKDTDGNDGAGSTSTFTLLQPAQSFFIEISGGLQLSAFGIGDPLLKLSADVLLEIDSANKRFTLSFNGQLELIKLGTVGATSGMFVLDMGDGTSRTPGFWGVATLETNFKSLEQYGLYLTAKGTLQVNTTGVEQPMSLVLKGLGDGGTDVLRQFTLAPGSFSLELVGQARIRPPGTTTDLVRLQGGFVLSIQTAQGFQLTMFATAELSFGIGEAQLTYAKATALLIINEDGVAGSITIGAGGGIGLPDVGDLFTASGTVTVLFNSMRHDVTFTIPASFKPLLINGDPGQITIFGSAPGLDGKRNPNAPARGEIYAKAIVQAHLMIKGGITLDGYIGITFAVDPQGFAYRKLDGAVGGTIPVLGSVTGVINLAQYVGTKNGMVGRIQLTLGSNGIPGVSLNGQFLLELNSFSDDQTIQTFAVRTTVNSKGVTVFDGFARDAAGNLLVVDNTIKIHNGVHLLFVGDLRIGDFLTITGHVELTVGSDTSGPLLQLTVDGTMSIAPIGTVTVYGGFRVDSTGLVARASRSTSTSRCPA